MSRQNGCTGCLGCLTILVVAPWLIFASIYLFCSKSAEEAVQDVSIQDVLCTAGLVFDDEEENERKQAYVKALVAETRRETGIDLAMPIFAVLAKNDKVKNLVVKCECERDGNGVYSICYDMDGKSWTMVFGATSASLFRKELGHATYIGDRADLMDQVGPLYKMPKECVEILKNFIRRQESLPNN